jgi:hypothetical protein
MGEEAGRNLGMRLNQFTDMAYEGLKEGKEEVYIGHILDKGIFDELVEKRRELFGMLSGVLRAHSG